MHRPAATTDRNRVVRREEGMLPFLLARLRHWHAQLVSGGRQVCGIPDYQTYLAHQRRHHPDQPVLSYEAFFRQGIDARYGGRGRMRCC